MKVRLSRRRLLTSGVIATLAVGVLGTTFADARQRPPRHRYPHPVPSATQTPTQTTPPVETTTPPPTSSAPTTTASQWFQYNSQNYTGWPTQSNPYDSCQPSGSNNGPGSGTDEYVLMHLKPAS